MLENKKQKKKPNWKEGDPPVYYAPIGIDIPRSNLLKMIK
jgi:hypothetical protein